MEGLSRAMFFLDGRNMVLGELLTGSPSGAPASRSWGFGMGQLVTDSRLLAANPYIFWVRSAGPKGSLPFFEEKTID